MGGFIFKWGGGGGGVHPMGGSSFDGGGFEKNQGRGGGGGGGEYIPWGASVLMEGALKKIIGWGEGVSHAPSIMGNPLPLLTPITEKYQNL